MKILLGFLERHLTFLTYTLTHAHTQTQIHTRTNRKVWALWYSFFSRSGESLYTRHQHGVGHVLGYLPLDTHGDHGQSQASPFTCVSLLAMSCSAYNILLERRNEWSRWFDCPSYVCVSGGWVAQTVRIAHYARYLTSLNSSEQICLLDCLSFPDSTLLDLSWHLKIK